ncbi:hypothetical protein F4860DRAFT_441662 [Xylaria cubensis]|nr:hypothetical protein F4860DRAFT_441662 [Xylaria cubensis]
METLLPSRPGDFRVAIICAQTSEFDIFSLLFDEFYDEDCRFKGENGVKTCYTTGRISNNNVVLALLPQNESAASAAAIMRASFDAVELALFVHSRGYATTSEASEGELLFEDKLIDRSNILAQYNFSERHPHGFLYKEAVKFRPGHQHEGVRSLLAVLETSHGLAMLQQGHENFINILKQKIAQRNATNSTYPLRLNEKLLELFQDKHPELLNCACSRCSGIIHPMCHEASQSTQNLRNLAENHEQRTAEKQGKSPDKNDDNFQGPALYIRLVEFGETKPNLGWHEDNNVKKGGNVIRDSIGVWKDSPCLVVTGQFDHVNCVQMDGSGGFMTAIAASVVKALIELYTQSCSSQESLIGPRQSVSTDIRHSKSFNGDRTFRVRGVPLDWDIKRLQSFLAEQDDAAGPTVQSLAEEVHGRSYTATISYCNIPNPLQTAESGRPMQISLLSKSDELSRHQILVVDDSFHGITPFYSPSQADHKIDIIAISGLGGHAFGSFKQKRGKHMWMRDALPYDMTVKDGGRPIARVMVYGYESKVAQSDSIQSLEDLGTALHSSLLLLVNTTPLKPIIFIAHSLGGLMVKQAIISLSKSKSEDDQKLARAISGLVFFGVPHHGLDVSSLIPMAGDGPSRALVESLGRTGSRTLGLLHQEFQEALGILNNVEIFCFFETMLSPTAVQDKNGKWEMKGPPAVLVTKLSATHCHTEDQGLEKICAINRTHSEMVKFGPEDPEYDKALPRIKSLAQRALRALDQSQILNPNVVQDGHWVVPFGRNKDFVGREEILKRIVESVRPGAEMEDCQRIAIEGLGGVGKTQIALETAFRVKALYPHCSVFWVPAVDAASFESALLKIGQQIKVKGIDDDKADVRSLVQTALSESRDAWLLIVDNADDLELLFGSAALRDCLPFSCKGSILFTTRNHEAVRKLGIRSSDVIHVSGMNETEATDLFKRNLDIGRMGDPRVTAELLESLAYLPLAIKQASAYMDQTGITMRRYLELCRSNDETFLKLLGKEFEDYGRYKGSQNPVATTWLISFRQISRDNPLAAQKLRIMSILAKDVPKSLLWIGEDELEAEEAIGTLKSYTFISERVDKSSYELHRLIRLAMKNWLNQQGELKGCVTAVLKRLDEVFPPPTHKNRHVWEPYLPHALAALELGDKSIDGKAMANLLPNVAESYQTLGKFREAEALYRQALELQTKFRGKEHSSVLCSMDGVAGALFGLCLFEQAEIIYRQVFQVRTRVLGAKAPDTISTMNNLALTLGRQGKLVQAEKMHRQTVELHQSVLNTEHPNTLQSMNDLGYALRAGGKYKEAEVLYEETLRLRMQVHGLEHPKTLDTMCCLALSLHAQGKFNEAAKVHRQTLDLRAKILGAEHPDTLSSMNNFAYTLRGQGKVEEAEALDWQTLELRIKVLGAEHPDTLWSMNGLANGFRSQGKYELAEMMYRQTLELRIKVLGSKHPNTFDSMDNLASVLESLGKYKEAEAMYREALKLGTIVRAANHPHTLDSMNGVAHTLLSQGELDKAETMYWETLELRTKALGTGHPHTFETMDGLALTLHAQKKYEQARKLHQLIIDLRIENFGADHPDTLNSMHNLKLALESRGE